MDHCIVCPMKGSHSYIFELRNVWHRTNRAPSSFKTNRKERRCIYVQPSGFNKHCTERNSQRKDIFSNLWPLLIPEHVHAQISMLKPCIAKSRGRATAFGFHTTLSTQGSRIMHHNYVSTACALLWGQTQLFTVAFYRVPVPYPDGLYWDLTCSLPPHDSAGSHATGWCNSLDNFVCDVCLVCLRGHQYQKLINNVSVS